MTWVAHESSLPVPMRDGTVLRADIWRPSRPGKYPVILARLPYNKVQTQDLVYPHPSWFARHGYVVVTQDVRGCWESEGEFVPFRSETQDGEDTIGWLNGLPYTNGNVGMYGFSYPGAIQLQTALSNPDGLRCICPAMTSPDFYEGWTYNNGAFSLAFAVSWAFTMCGDIARRRGDGQLEQQILKQFNDSPAYYGILPLTAIPNLGPGEIGAFFQDWLRHETRDEYWRDLDLTDRLETMNVAVLGIGGLYDVFLEGTVSIFDRVSKGPRGQDARLLITPWMHIPWASQVGSIDLGPAAKNGIGEVQLSFFDRWLRDGGNGSDERVRAFVTGRNDWIILDDWPPPSRDWTLFLHARSRANSLEGDGTLDEEAPGHEPPDVFTYDPAFPIPSIGGRSCCFDFVAPMGPHDQRTVERLNGVLVYTSRELTADTTIAGMIRVHLFAATSAADTDWTVKVCDVHPNGRSINTQEAIVRARFAGGTDRSRPIPPGDETEFVLQVGTCAHLFRAGHRVRLEISSSNFPHWDRNLNTGHRAGRLDLSDRVVAIQTVFHDAAHPSRVILPVVDL